MCNVFKQPPSPITYVFCQLTDGQAAGAGSAAGCSTQEAVVGAVSISTLPSKDYRWIFLSKTYTQPWHSRQPLVQGRWQWKDMRNSYILVAMLEDTVIPPIQMTETVKHVPYRKRSASATDADISVGSQIHHWIFISDPARVKHNLGIRTPLFFFLSKHVRLQVYTALVHHYFNMLAKKYNYIFFKLSLL